MVRPSADQRSRSDEKDSEAFVISADECSNDVRYFVLAFPFIKEFCIRGLGEYYHSGRKSGHQKSPSEYAKEFRAFIDDLYKEYGKRAAYVFIDPSAKGLAEEIKRVCPEVLTRDAENTVDLGISRLSNPLYTV